MAIENDITDTLILICAFRYVLGRRGYIVRVVADEIKKQWENLSESDRELIKREICYAVDHGQAGY